MICCKIHTVLIVFLPVLVTATNDVNSVTCDFSDDNNWCGYTVGECWNSATVSSSDTSKGNAELLNCESMMPIDCVEVAELLPG